MGLVFFFGAIAMFATFLWQVRMFFVLFYAIKQKKRASVIRGILYVLSAIASYLFFWLSYCVADYGGFSKAFTAFSLTVLAGMYVTTLGFSLKKRFVMVAGILLAIAPFIHLYIYI